jgi:hypothetical protein
MFNSGQLDVHYIICFFLDVSFTCFGCYLHSSSGAQLQRTAIGFVCYSIGAGTGFGTALHLSTVSYRPVPAPMQ